MRACLSVRTQRQKLDCETYVLPKISRGRCRSTTPRHCNTIHPHHRSNPRARSSAIASVRTSRTVGLPERAPSSTVVPCAVSRTNQCRLPLGRRHVSRRKGGGMRAVWELGAVANRLGLLRDRLAGLMWGSVRHMRSSPHQGIKKSVHNRTVISSIFYECAYCHYLFHILVL